VVSTRYTSERSTQASWHTWTQSHWPGDKWFSGMQRPGLKTFEWYPVVIRSPPTQSVRIKSERRERLIKSTTLLRALWPRASFQTNSTLWSSSLSKPAESYKLLNPEKGTKSGKGTNPETSPNTESGSRHRTKKMGTGFPETPSYPD
jgi:hypothetical protein